MVVYDIQHGKYDSGIDFHDYLTPFMAPNGSKGAKGKLDSYTNLQIRLDMIFNMGNMIVASIFTTMEY